MATRSIRTSCESNKSYLTEEEKQRIIESARKNVRASMALEGIYISDSNFEKIKALVDQIV